MWMCSPVTGCVKDTLWAWSIRPQGRGVPYRSSPTRGDARWPVHANLMLAAGEQLNIDIRTRGQASAALKALEYLDARLRGLSAGADTHLAAIVAIASDRLVDELLVPVDFALGERQIVLFERVVDDHLVKGGLRLLVEREQHHAGGVTVQAIERLHVGRGKAVAHRQQQVAGVVGERAFTGAVAVDDHAGGLVDGHEPASQ